MGDKWTGDYQPSGWGTRLVGLEYYQSARLYPPRPNTDPSILSPGASYSHLHGRFTPAASDLGDVSPSLYAPANYLASRGEYPDPSSDRKCTAGSDEGAAGESASGMHISEYPLIAEFAPPTTHCCSEPTFLLNLVPEDAEQYPHVDGADQGRRNVYGSSNPTNSCYPDEYYPPLDYQSPNPRDPESVGPDPGNFFIPGNNDTF
ncbi:hypothetical protein NDN08_007809 [Rhodosorus marinus]|uniref:Uncharacterized protein n=1 Tax=Rhodosorus marinus TaxID=101924 RepID=A0AAV8V2Q2_9RHOD|nr:hypothetical protein NDN08_007809 [Rhodosorus marinus]